MPEPTPNTELAYAVLDHIDAHPEQWDQGMWWCGTSGCYAGWTLALSGEKPVYTWHGWTAADGSPISERAAQLLGFADLDDMDAITDAAGDDWLFRSDNTRADLGRMVAAIFGPRPAPAVADD